MDISKIKVRIKNKVGLRKGRGSGSGFGKRAGRGDKGAGSRSGVTQPYIGHEGGNVPYFRRLPKRGFTSFKPVEYQIVNLKSIEDRLKDTLNITPEVLKKANLIKNTNQLVKILADAGKGFTAKGTISADKFSLKAKELIEKAGGKIEIIKR